jgi:hypothetical protein
MSKEGDLTTLNISLPRAQREFVEAEAARCNCTTDEYLSHLIREAEQRRAWSRLEQELLLGLDSGDPIEVGTEYWQEKRRRLLERHSGGVHSGPLPAELDREDAVLGIQAGLADMRAGRTMSLDELSDRLRRKFSCLKT